MGKFSLTFNEKCFILYICPRDRIPVSQIHFVPIFPRQWKWRQKCPEETNSNVKFKHECILDLHNLSRVSGARFAASQLLRVWYIEDTVVRKKHPTQAGQLSYVLGLSKSQNWKSIKFCIIMNRSPRPVSPPPTEMATIKDSPASLRGKIFQQQLLVCSSSK